MSMHFEVVEDPSLVKKLDDDDLINTSKYWNECFAKIATGEWEDDNKKMSQACFKMQDALWKEMLNRCTTDLRVYDYMMEMMGATGRYNSPNTR